GNGPRPPRPNAGFSYACWTARTIGSGAGSWATRPPMTPNSTRLSSASASCRRASAACRAEWRPSRWFQRALALLAVLAATSILASEAPRPLAWPAALAALAHGARLCLRERARPAHSFVIRGAEVLVDGAPVAGFELRWRGPLAFAAWRDGEGRRRRARPVRARGHRWHHSAPRPAGRPSMPNPLRTLPCIAIASWAAPRAHRRLDG